MTDVMERARHVVEAITGRRFDSTDRGEVEAANYIAAAFLAVRKETLEEAVEEAMEHDCHRKD